MLTELVVEGLGVIERAELELERGCSALTGETGAGKTLVVAALGLLVGGRSDRALVREGASEARVEGRFVVSPRHPALDVLRAHGVVEAVAADDPEAEAEVILTRTVTADGKGGRARINGRLVTVATLAEAGGHLVEIAGQHEARGIGAPTKQRTLLDLFAGPECALLAAEVSDAVRAAGRAERELEDLLSHDQQRARELDLLRYEITEIHKADLHEGEVDTLTADAERLEHAESIALGLERAGHALGGEGGATETMSAALGDLAAAAQRDPSLAELVGRLESAALEVADVAGEIGGHVVTPDPEALETTRARLDVISRLARKYGGRSESLDETAEAAILGHLARAEVRVTELETMESSLDELRSNHDDLLARANEMAIELGARRRDAAPRLEAAMEERLGDLALGGARFEVGLSERRLFEGGTETVELRVAANPGESPRPFAKVASGGELARIALALHLLTTGESAAGQSTGRTMVFDEVDAGVGGRAAQSVGHALAALSRSSGAQVLLVTHLPQVAACADLHYRVSKTSDDKRASASVARLTGSERVDELSRMLAGMPESERAREHAKELLETSSAR